MPITLDLIRNNSGIFFVCRETGEVVRNLMVESMDDLTQVQDIFSAGERQTYRVRGPQEMRITSRLMPGFVIGIRDASNALTLDLIPPDLERPNPTTASVGNSSGVARVEFDGAPASSVPMASVPDAQAFRGQRFQVQFQNLGQAGGLGPGAVGPIGPMGELGPGPHDPGPPGAEGWDGRFSSLEGQRLWEESVGEGTQHSDRILNMNRGTAYSELFRTAACIARDSHNKLLDLGMEVSDQSSDWMAQRMFETWNRIIFRAISAPSLPRPEREIFNRVCISDLRSQIYRDCESAREIFSHMSGEQYRRSTVFTSMMAASLRCLESALQGVLLYSMGTRHFIGGAQSAVFFESLWTEMARITEDFRNRTPTVKDPFESLPPLHLQEDRANGIHGLAPVAQEISVFSPCYVPSVLSGEELCVAFDPGSAGQTGVSNGNFTKHSEDLEDLLDSRSIDEIIETMLENLRLGNLDKLREMCWQSVFSHPALHEEIWIRFRLSLPHGHPLRSPKFEKSPFLAGAAAANGALSSSN